MTIDLGELERLYGEHVASLERGTARALEESGWDGLVVHSGTPTARSAFDDQEWPLRPTPHFQHWAPLPRADSAVLYVPGRRPVLYENVAASYWEKPAAPETEHFRGAFEVVAVADPERVKDLLPAGVRLAFVGEDAARAARWGLAEGVNPPELVRRLDALRARKTPYEVSCCAEASRRAAAGHERLRKAFLDGDHSELALHLMYLDATAQDDAETPYKNIVALGRNAATLHHVTYGRRPSGAATESLLVDAGATCQGYHADITRTWMKGEAGAFGALLAGMERLQREMTARVVTGIAYERLHDETHGLLAPLLREVGIVRGASDEELVTSGTTRLFLPHGLGHSLGLQTHDVGCKPTAPRQENPFLRFTATIAPGHLFTIEPGCYFIDAKLAELRAGPLAARVDWAVVEQLARFGGIRIEDNLAVGATGVRNLTREAFAGV